ncbi:DUF6508 domain-containing protein [Peptococcus simiae]|uniref:DUF6508 domain-containing protein n=1 Tax=Peptococcus simiae TaxID=1643805 RepID=A0ABW9GYJ2_9FIRM
MTYKPITDYRDRLFQSPAGHWVIDDQNEGTEAAPTETAHVVYSDEVKAFVQAVGRFQKKNPLLGLRDFSDILKAYGLQWGLADMQEAPLDRMDARGVMALIVAAIEAEKFHDGALLTFFETGCLRRWLDRLQVLDRA